MAIELERFPPHSRRSSYTTADPDVSALTANPILSSTADSACIVEALPPCDTGPRAWRFLLGCFMLEAALWGKLYSARLPSQKYYS